MSIQEEKAIHNVFLAIEELLRHKFNKNEIALLCKLAEHLTITTEKLKKKSEEIQNQ